MAKGSIGKLAKLRCMIKRWQAKAHNNNLIHQIEEPSTGDDHHHEDLVQTRDQENVPAGMHPVFVGKSRHRYLISSYLVLHPLFRNLVLKSGGKDRDESSSDLVLVDCEVVLFEHLLWMLDNADPQPESLDELVDFYAC